MQAVQCAISIYIGTNLKTSFCLFFALSYSENASTYDRPAEVDKGWGLTQMMDDNQPTRLTADTKDVCSKLWWWRRYCPGKTTAGGDKHQGFTFLGSYLPLMYWPVVRPCNASGFPMYWSSDFAKERNSATVKTPDKCLLCWLIFEQSVVIDIFYGWGRTRYKIEKSNKVWGAQKSSFVSSSRQKWEEWCRNGGGQGGLMNTDKLSDIFYRAFDRYLTVT